MREPGEASEDQDVFWTEGLSREFFDQAPIGKTVVSPDGSAVRVNQALAEMLGYSVAELEARSFRSITHPDDLATSVEIARALFAGERDTVTLEKRFRAKAGHYVWVHVTTTLLRDPAGKPLQLLAYMIDITQRKQLDLDRARAEDELRTLARAIEQSPSSIVITDRDGNIEYVNPRFELVTGYARHEVIGKNPRILQSGLTPPETYRELWQAISGGGEWRGELCNRRKNGELFWEAAAISGLTGATGEIAHYVGVKHEITDRKLAERALRDSEASLREAQVIAELGSYVLDVATGTWTSSEMLDRVFGIDAAYPRTVEGWGALVHPDDRAKLLDYLQTEVLGSGRAFDKEYRIVRRSDGAVCWVQGRGAVTRDPVGRPIEMRGTIQDITRRKAAERERAELEGMFHQAQKMESIGRLAGGVAHDFNNLLSVIVGYTDLVVDGLAADDPHRADIAEIRTAAQRATDLTRQLLAFSRRQLLESRVINLNEVIAGMQKLLGRLLGADIKIVVDPAPDLGNAVADPGQVEQIVMNLAVNARDAMPRGGRLVIETSNAELDDGYARTHAGVQPGPYVKVVVTDTGSGMDEETQARIFEPFFTTKEAHKGTGLGLATVFGIVSQSGGHIAVSSKIGNGTAFTFYLPRVDAPVTTEAPSVATTAASPARTDATILLVEDEDQLRVLAGNVLRRQGHTVLEASNGGEALLLCEQHPGTIDLLVTDVVLPTMDGRQLAARLAPLQPAMKVLYMSGYSDDAMLNHGIVASGLAFLPKPITPLTLTQKVGDVLDGPPPPHRS